jgi:hypothetical protein
VFHPSLSAFRSGYGCQTALLKIIEDCGTTWASFNFSGKMELFIDLFIKFVIGLTIAGFANFRSFAEMPSRPVAFF